MRVIYLVQPTKRNIEKIIDDFKRDLYDSVELHFVHEVSEPLLSQLAVAVGRLGMVHKITKIAQHALNFITLTPFMFTLNTPGLFQSFRAPTVASSSVGDQFTEVYEQISHSLYSILATVCATSSQSKTLPIVISPKRSNNDHCANILKFLKTQFAHAM